MHRILAIVPLLFASPIANAFQMRDAPAVVSYGTVGGWGVFVDLEMERSCYLVGSYRTGTTISFGADRSPGRESGYLTMANPRWSGIEDGRSYPVVLRYDRSKPWVGRARAAVFEGIPTLTLKFSDPRFAKQFASSDGMVLTMGGRRMAAVELGASSGAIRAMGRCQSEVDALIGNMDGDRPAAGDAGRT
jgi:hypothetical protein